MPAAPSPTPTSASNKQQLATLLGIEEVRAASALPIDTSAMTDLFAQVGFRRGKKKEVKKEFPFWHQQPVPKIGASRAVPCRVVSCQRQCGVER